MSIRERKSRGKTVFCVQVRVSGHPHESRTFPTRKLAQQWLEDRTNELKYGLTNLAKSNGKSPSLRELSERYGVTFRVSAWEGNVLNNLLVLPIANKPIVSITEKEVAELKELYLSKRKVKPGTFQKYLSLLRRPIKKARTIWGYRGLIDPFEDIGIKATEKPRERLMSTAEYALICDSLAQPLPYKLTPRIFSRYHFRLLIDFALETAMRRGEICKVRKAHISEDYTTLYIPETKTNTPRTIPLSVRAAEILRELAEETSGEYLFWITPGAVTKRFNYICDTLKIKDLHFHDLRHTSLSSYDRRGFSKGMLKLIGGHKTDKMLVRYLHAELGDVLQKMRDTCSASLPA